MGRPAIRAGCHAKTVSGSEILHLMPITPSQFQEMVLRVERNRGQEEKLPTEVSGSDDEREADLHRRIIWWCDSQFPFVPYIHARTDKRSTIAVGAPDFAVFYKLQCLLIECKSVKGKMSVEQMAWTRRANEQGFAIHVVRSFREFLNLIESTGSYERGSTNKKPAQ